jgi:hypothetical protein
MLPPKWASLSKAHRRLLDAFEALGEQDRETLLAFAEFLARRAEPAVSPKPRPLAEPKPLPRPAQESVVAAIRRLSDSYFMLDRGVLLHDASSLMSAHVMQGKPAAEVIDELEELFHRAYDRLRTEHQG